MADSVAVIRLRLRQSRLRCRDDRGFTLVEAVLSLMIAAMLLMALAASLVVQVKGATAARQNQQSIDQASDQIEQVRALSFAAVSMDPTGADFAGDKCGGSVQVWCITGNNPSTWAMRYPDPNGSAVILSEPLYVGGQPGGPLLPHKHACANGATCKVYATTPAGSNNTYRRVSVVVTWMDHGQPKTRVTSTQITNTRRGLPLPLFAWSPNAAAPAATQATAGGQLRLFSTLVNQGAPETFNFSVTVRGANGVTPTWSFVWYSDDNGNAVWDDAAETRILDSDNDGTFDSGVMQTDATLNTAAVALIPADTTAQTYTVTMKATPTAANIGSPGSTPAERWQYTTSVQVQATGTFYRQLYMHNWADVGNQPMGDTTTPPVGQSNTLNTVSPPAVSTQLYNYDTNLDDDPGRTVGKGASGATDTDPGKSVSFLYGVNQTSTITGTAYVTVDAVPEGNDPAFAAGNLVVYLRAETSTGWQTIGQAAPTVLDPFGVSEFRNLSFTIPITGSYSVAANRHIQVVIQVSPASTEKMRLAYDTTSYTGGLQLPFTTGNP